MLDGGFRMMNLLVPLSVTVSLGETQLVVHRSVHCCRFQPGEGEGHEMTAVFVLVRDTFSLGMLSAKS